MAKRRPRCWLCPILIDEGDGSLFTFHYESGAFNRGEVVVEMLLCKDCTEWALKVPEALDAIVRTRFKVG